MKTPIAKSSVKCKDVCRIESKYTPRNVITEVETDDTDTTKPYCWRKYSYKKAAPTAFIAALLSSREKKGRSGLSMPNILVPVS